MPMTRDDRKTPSKQKDKIMCDGCGTKPSEYFSLGGTVLCKDCAYHTGLICGETNKISDDNPKWIWRRKRRFGY